MAGKRILDAAALFNASKAVAQKHIILRSHQLDVFNKTSTLAKAVKDQTDRVTLTAQAAAALAQRFNESPIAQEKQKHGKTAEGHIQPTSGSSSTIPDPRTQRPPPSPKQAKELQRQSESQIPSSVAGSQSASDTDAEIQVDQDKDVFYSRSGESSPVLSALPRVKLPKHPESSQEGDEHLKESNINADVYYSSIRKTQETMIPRQEAIPEQEQDGEVNTDVFHSPRIAKMLTGKEKQPSKGLEMKAASQGPIYKSNRKGMNQVEFYPVSDTQKTLKESQSQSINTKTTKDELRSLGGDLAKDAKNAETKNLETLSEVGTESASTPYQMQESRVPSSRFGRLWQYGGLATSMAFGAVGEGLRRVTGGESEGSIMLSAANMDRLVAKLSRMRGAALKLGQMMSFQDSKMLPAPIAEVLARVQDSADYMPPSQRNRVLSTNLGADWADLFSEFNEVPIAAASIGQVHSAVLKETGQRVAVKVQYPGVADSIDSDLNNLSILLNASRLLPKGLYLDKTIANARIELAWECDYVREAECAQRFHSLLQDDIDTFTVPRVIAEASGPQVLTMEFMAGKSVVKLPSPTQEQKDWIATQILRLCLREITEFHYMQTDPNWTNFLYNADTKKLELLDFGASREYPDKFIEPYIRVLAAAANGDRAAVREISIELGYLTGSESKAMTEAHVDSVLILAEPFRPNADPEYSFQGQDVTERVRALIPVMIRERLRPPPEETYSLHRKLSGAFLLCARLGATVRCRELFVAAMEKAQVEV